MYPICVDPLEFKDYGRGVSLYFEILKEIVMILFALIVKTICNPYR